jgi:hypothetical protein
MLDLQLCSRFGGGRRQRLTSDCEMKHGKPSIEDGVALPPLAHKAAMLAKGSSVTNLFNRPDFVAQGGGWPWSAPEEPQSNAGLTEGNATDRARAQADQFLSGQTPRIQGDAAMHGIEHSDKEPTDKQKRYLIDNPDSWQVIDQMFKPGTAARILGEAKNRQQAMNGRAAT